MHTQDEYIACLLAFLLLACKFTGTLREVSKFVGISLLMKRYFYPSVNGNLEYIEKGIKGISVHCNTSING